MVWQCTACKFSDNESGQDACVACGSKRPEGEEDEPEEEAAGNREDRDDVGIVVIELPGEEKLGVKLIPPVDGVVGHGLAIESINNPLLEDKVQAGDLIVAIGGQDLDGMGFSSAIDLIRKLPRPLGISFEIDALRRQKVAWEKFQASKGNELDTKLSTYTVVFDDGPIGLNLEEGVHHGIDGAIVRALKGQAKSSGMITVGDILYKVNETNVLCMPYMEVMNALRNAPAPKKVQFVPKEKLVDVQRMNFQYSEAFRLHEPTSLASQKLMIPRTVKDKYDRDNWSIAQLILDNKVGTIRRGRMYKQGRVLRNWNSRYFVLSVSKMEYFNGPSSITSRGEMSFLNHRCTVRSLPGTNDVVCRSPNVTAEYLLELRVDVRRMVMACISESDKKGWIHAIKLAIDASKIASRAQNSGESLHETYGSATFLDRNTGGRLSQFNYKFLSIPVIHVAVLSITNLARAGSSVNAFCEVTVGADTFQTSVVKKQRSPVWKQDNAASFEAPSDNMVLEIRIFDEHFFRGSELLATLAIPLKSLSNMHKTTKTYPLALGSRSAGAVLTLSLEYINKQKAYVEEQEHGRLKELEQLKTQAQMAADEATHYASRAEEEARMKLDQARQKAEAAMIAAQEEQREGKAAVEKAMAAAAEAKEEAERQLAEARRSQEDAQKLIEANRRVQAADDQLRRTGGDKQLEIALEQLCAGMGEAESLCFHVLERLRKDQNAQPFTAIQNRFRTVLEMNGGKSMVVRLVSATSVANALADLHREIDEVAVNEPNGMWKERWETDRTVMKQKLFDRGFSHMVNDLHEAGAQAEALTLLIHEIKRNKASYSEKELEFLRAVRNYVVSFSALAVPAEEKWLIARHDIQLNDDSFCRGSFGKIYRGKYMNADVVIKCIEIQSDNDRSDFLREVRIWHEVSRHPNITPFFGACHVGLPCFMACKYITDGSLPEYLRSQTEEGCSKVWRALLGVIHGLQFLHSKDIVHGDLKGNNILVEGDTAMLTDFGMSFYRSEERPRFDNVGAIRWRAPEFLTEGPSFEADIYSLGMCIVEATTGNPPWGLLPDVAVAWHLKNGKFLTPPRCMSDNEWALVCGMCELDPAKRISLTDVEKIVTEFAELEEDNERGAWA